jgi:phosphoserine phosphatase
MASKTKIKLFAFDLEGTLITQTPLPELGEPPDHRSPGLWPRIAHALGPAAIKADHEMAHAFHAGHYKTYTDWCHASLQSFQEHGLTQSLFNRLASSCALSPGVESLVDQLRSRDVIMAVISGGFHAQARWAQSQLGMRHAHAAADLTFAPEGRLHSWCLSPSDYRGKVGYLRLLLEEYGINPAETAFIGDGANDRHMATFVGKSFAYRATPALKAVTDHSVEHFDEVAGYL